jgi:hypothetical protein
MPNCDFYAVGPDLELVLDFIFARSGCRVFELYSPYDTDLVEFHSFAEVAQRYPVGQCKGACSSVLLQLLPESAGEVVVRRINLRPESCGGATFRFEASGWGLIQLDLGGVSPMGVVHSHTGHNSAKRARAWEPTYADVLGPASGWTWSKVESTSRRINAFIRKSAVQKQGSRPVLPAAAVALATITSAT